MKYSLHAFGQVIAGSGAKHQGFDNKTKAEIAAAEYAGRKNCPVEVKQGSRTVFTARARK